MTWGRHYNDTIGLDSGWLSNFQILSIQSNSLKGKILLIF